MSPSSLCKKPYPVSAVFAGIIGGDDSDGQEPHTLQWETFFFIKRGVELRTGKKMNSGPSEI